LIPFTTFIRFFEFYLLQDMKNAMQTISKNSTQPPPTLSLSVIYQPTAALQDYPCNARTHSKCQIRQIADSIAAFGFTNPTAGEILAAGKLTYDALLNLCVWAKDKGGMGSFYRSQHELVFVFRNGKASHRNNVQLGKFGRNRTNVWQYPGVNTLSRQSEEGNLLALHPTVKPVSLVADALLDCTQLVGWFLIPS
jgi:hypothetical protein